MDERQIETILKKSWSPEPPEGMKARILRRARAGTERSWFGINRWKLALAGGWLVIVILSGALDQARQTRVIAMVSGGKSANTTGPAPRDLGEWKCSIEGFLAMTSMPENLGGKGTKESDSL